MSEKGVHMKILDKIHIVASGDSGFALTDSCDCTVYLLEGKGGCVLIDAGCGTNTSWILDEIRLTGHEPEEVTAILLTHGHGDHAGGAAELKEACKARVYGLEETAGFVSAGDERRLSVDAAKAAGVYEREFHFTPCPVTAIKEEQVLSISGFDITAYGAEGHCKGHCCYAVELGGKKVLFSGDSVFAGGKISLQAIWDCDLQSYIKTCRRLCQLRPEVYLPAHGPFFLNRGYQVLEKAVRCLDELTIPGNF